MKKNDYILITGASRGIGRETAFTFARLGFPILATARNEKDLQSLQAEIKESTEQKCLILPGHIGDESFVQELFSFLTLHGHLKALINNAGISHVGLLQDMTLSQWNRLFQTNVTSLFLTCRAAIPLFLAQGAGSIVNVSSVWGAVGASCETA